MTTPPTIAHYRVTSKRGEGGMGAVYRAADTARMARFEREAQCSPPS